MPTLRATADWRIAATRVRGLPGIVFADSRKHLPGVRSSRRCPVWRRGRCDGSGELFEDVWIGCGGEKFRFDRARSFARYQGSLVRAIVLLRFEEMEPLGGLVCG